MELEELSELAQEKPASQVILRYLDIIGRYIHTYISTYLPTYLPTYVPTHIPTDLPTYLQ